MIKHTMFEKQKNQQSCWPKSAQKTTKIKPFFNSLRGKFESVGNNNSTKNSLGSVGSPTTGHHAYNLCSKKIGNTNHL